MGSDKSTIAGLEILLAGGAGGLGSATAELLEAEGAAGAAFITPANPHSKRRTDAENHAAFLSFNAAMRKTPYACHPGVGRDPSGNWSEQSLLIVGIPRAEAEALGRSLGQNAIVYVEKGKLPELAVLV